MVTSYTFRVSSGKLSNFIHLLGAVSHGVVVGPIETGMHGATPKLHHVRGHHLDKGSH